MNLVLDYHPHNSLSEHIRLYRINMMLLMPLYALLTSISVIFTLTSSLVPFGLSICQRTFTISSMLSNGHLSIPFHPDDYIDAYLTRNNWEQCFLTTLDPIT